MCISLGIMFLCTLCLQGSHWNATACKDITDIFSTHVFPDGVAETFSHAPRVIPCHDHCVNTLGGHLLCNVHHVLSDPKGTYGDVVGYGYCIPTRLDGRSRISSTKEHTFFLFTANNHSVRTFWRQGFTTVYYPACFPLLVALHFPILSMSCLQTNA